MYADYKDRGFTILAFPCNQFGSQEPAGSTSKPQSDVVAKFVKDTYGVEFPLMQQVEVMGRRQSPIFKWIRDQQHNGGDMDWNFEKYLIDGEGNLVGHWNPSQEFDSARAEVEKLLN